MLALLDRRGSFKGFWRVLIAFGLLNAPFWWLAQSNFLSRSWFNVDLLIPLLMATFSPLAGLVCLALLWALDMAVSQSLAWHFHSPFEFIRSIEFLPSVHLAGYVAPGRLAMSAPFVLCAALAILITRKVKTVWRSAIVIFVVVALIDVFNGSSFFWFSATRPLPGNVAGSAVKMTVSSMLGASDESLRRLPPGTSLASKVDVRAWALAHPDRSVMIVLIESMGLHQDPRMRAWLREQLADAPTLERFDLREIDVPFRGSTTAAELRELCDLEGSYRSLNTRSGATCLPHVFDAMGWQSIGLHGFSRRMFMRGKWWESTGLQRRLFAEDLAIPNQVLCGGAFEGICDADVLRRAAREASEPKKFVYVVTLNSHLPLGPTSVPLRLDAVCKAADVGTNACDLTAVDGHALQALREALLAVERRPLVLVVGDHAPPFTDLYTRQQYSQTMVPGFALIPKN
ncbi:LTA synthase family protein [soil metagenome]